jgi:Restriction endonuclease
MLGGLALLLHHVNPLECFRSLKGLAAARISAYTPVAPLLTFDKKDDRLVEGRKVIEGLSAGDNLAGMDWDDFEHLIRELFEKVFSAPGVDVRITRASRDRGVDAIIYDPDPIRGGRYIIQAKKFTNLVDVAEINAIDSVVFNGWVDYIDDRQRTQAQETAIYSIAIRTLYEAISSDRTYGFMNVLEGRIRSCCRCTNRRGARPGATADRSWPCSIRPCGRPRVTGGVNPRIDGGA